MEKINRDNYQLFFVDYLDGQMDGDALQALSRFLIDNPDLKNELSLAGSIRLDPDPTEYPNKTDLYRKEEEKYGIASDDFICIARMEGDLSESESHAFDQKLEMKSDLKSRFQKFERAHLIIDETLRFDGKAKLLKRRRLIPVWTYAVAAAAALLAVTWMVWPVDSDSSGDLIEESVMANRETTEYLRIDSKSQLVQQRIFSTFLHSSSLRMTLPDIHTIIEPIRPIEPSNIPSPTIIAGLARGSVNMVDAYSMADASQYETIPEAALRLFREKILKQDPELVKIARFTLWEVADRGLESMNDFAGTEMHLDRSYNDVGKLERVSFNSRLIDLSTPLR